MFAGTAIWFGENVMNIFSFQKGQIMIIDRVDARQMPTIFFLKDLKNDKVRGSWQKEELVLANKPQKDDTFILRTVGKEIKQIKVKGESKSEPHVYVSYLFYPRKFNEWIPLKNIKK